MTLLGGIFFKVQDKITFNKITCYVLQYRVNLCREYIIFVNYKI
jgi:hypothetical protein